MFRSSFIISTFFGFLSILLVVYLVLYKTKTDFKEYSKMLLIFAMADLYVVFGDFLCQMVSVNKKDLIIILESPNYERFDASEPLWPCFLSRISVSVLHDWMAVVCDIVPSHGIAYSILY
jgi:hypothetical protein